MAVVISGTTTTRCWWAKSCPLVCFVLLGVVVLLELHVWHCHAGVANSSSNSLLNDQEWRVVSSKAASRGGDKAGKVAAAASSASWQLPSLFLVDDLCGACRTTLTADAANRGVATTCGSWLLHQQKHDKLLVMPTECQLAQCHPSACSVNQKRYWRYDVVLEASGGGTSHYLSSIPDKHRIPDLVLQQAAAKSNDDAAADVLTHYFQADRQQRAAPHRYYYFEYNPSLVVLPPSYQEQWTSSNSSNNIHDNAPVYLASYRVSTQQSCFPRNTTLALWGNNWQNRIQRDRLGLALLRHDLSILADTVVDLPASFGKREDFRLFQLQAGQLYLGSFCKLVPLWVHPPHAPLPMTLSSRYSNWNASNTQTLSPVFPNLNVHSSFAFDVTIGLDRSYCSGTWKDQHKDDAKNINWFVVHGSNKDPSRMTTLVEYLPLGTLPTTTVGVGQAHRVHIVDEMGQHVAAKEDPARVFMDASLPHPSFYTLEQVVAARQWAMMESPFVRERGSACCMTIPDPRHGNNNSKTLLVGISHTKTRTSRTIKTKGTGIKPHQYLSRWYAFEQVPPFRTIATSGLFCLSKVPGGDQDNPVAALPLWKTLDFLDPNQPMDCPAIHFVMSIVQDVTNLSRWIIAYGVGDCTSWFVYVDKQQVIDLLFHGPPS